MNIQSKSKLPFPVEPGHYRRPVAGWMLSATGYVIGCALVGGSVAGSGVAGQLWGEFVGSVVFVVSLGLIFPILPLT